MGLASKIAAAQAAQGPAPYPAGPPTGPPTGLPTGPPTGPPTSQQVGPTPGGPPQSHGQYQPYPGGASGASAVQNPSQPPYSSSSPQPPHQSWPGSNMYSPPLSNQYGGTSPYGPVPSPQPPSSQPYQQPQWAQQQPPYSPQNAYGQPLQNTHGGAHQQPQQVYGVPPYQGQGQQKQHENPPYPSQQSYGGGYGPPQGQSGYPPQGGQPGYPPQGGQPGYPPQRPQGGYGQQPQSGQQQAGLPSQPVGPAQIQAYKQVLQATIQEKGLQGFYPPGSPQLDQIAQIAPQKIDILCQHWRVHRELGQDVIKLALFDIILYIDDSGSMAFEEGGERISDLKVILSKVAFAASLFDDDGVQVRFMNSSEQGNGIRTEQEVNDLVSRVRFSGLTPMGEKLRDKILQPLVIGPAKSGQLRKPVLIITVTDGHPTDDEKNNIFHIIKTATHDLARNPRYGKGAVSYQFAQVGNDLKAREFLGRLDEDPEVGPLVDCTSNFEVEADEMSRANPPVDLTPEIWLMKLLLGAVDSSYDTEDEKSSRGPQPQGGPGSYGGGPPQGGYGSPSPQQNYGQQGFSQQLPGGYGQPPPGQGQYGQQPGAYGGQWQQQQAPAGYGRPPPNQPPYGGPQGSPQGGYGTPPPPPRR